MPDQLGTALLACVALLLSSCRENAGVSTRSYGAQSSRSSSSLSNEEEGGNGDRYLNSVGHQNYSKNYYSENSYFKVDLNIEQSVPKHQENLTQGSTTAKNSNNTSAKDSGTQKLSGFLLSKERQDRDRGTSPLCAYRVMESGGRARLCFRDTQQGFTCRSGECQRVRSVGGQLVANVLANGSVLVQWGQESNRWQRGTSEEHREAGQDPTNTEETGRGGQKQVPKKTMEKEEHTNISSRIHPLRHRAGSDVHQGGFGLSCWWNGSYTQFECAAVHLGASCRDYLLNELHENIPYRICLRPLLLPSAHPNRLYSNSGHGNDPGECVEFTISPSGMQDIVIAMTAVGGAICVMLVIICLLVAYITENIMSPATQRTHTVQHSHHTHSHL